MLAGDRVKTRRWHLEAGAGTDYPARMSPHDRTVVDLSIQILRQAMADSGKARCDTVPVRLALRCLMPHCPEKWPLTTFWESAGQENEIGRAQGCTAAFNGIIRQLRLSGAWGD